MLTMNLTAEQRQLVLLIDNHVGRFPETPLGDEQRKRNKVRVLDLLIYGRGIWL